MFWLLSSMPLQCAGGVRSELKATEKRDTVEKLDICLADQSLVVQRWHGILSEDSKNCSLGVGCDPIHGRARISY